MTWWNPKRQRIVFVSILVFGTSAGLALGIREALSSPVLEVGEPRVRVEGGVATVQLTVRNMSAGTVFCPVVGIAAIDGDGLDLDSGIALPDLTDGRLAPRASSNYIGTLTGIEPQEFEEKLDEYVGFIKDENPCE